MPLLKRKDFLLHERVCTVRTKGGTNKHSSRPLQATTTKWIFFLEERPQTITDTSIGSLLSFLRYVTCLWKALSPTLQKDSIWKRRSTWDRIHLQSLNVGFAFESVNRWKKKSKGARSFPLWTRNERFRWRGLVARSQSIHRFIFWERSTPALVRRRWLDANWKSGSFIHDDRVALFALSIYFLN